MTSETGDDSVRRNVKQNKSAMRANKPGYNAEGTLPDRQKP